MSTKLRGLFVFCGLLLGGILFAQEKTVTGTVTDVNGFALPDASVKSSSGEEVFTDTDGNYSIQVNEGEVLTIESLGLEIVTVTVGASNAYDVTLRDSGIIELEGAVVTALGITREKKSLGYATQEISGETLSSVPVSNFADAMSGEVAGLDIKSSGTMGGSTNIIIRGYSSLLGNNQALIVIDGTPINNDVRNQTGQASGRGGYDYGNPASDINPNDIESVNVLKGAAATALYGSRGMNGVVMITTKKGKRSKGIGVEINSSLVVGSADKETLPKYQKKYGGGYGGPGTSFYNGDINNDGINDIIVDTYNDASMGDIFDPNIMVYNWDSFYPQLPSYLQARPWVAAKNDPNSIWKTSATYVNSAAFSGGNEQGSYRLGYTNFYQEGNLDNSLLRRNTIDFSSQYQLSEKLKASADISYTNTLGKGRIGTGYSGVNPMQSMRQWWNMATDMYEQRDAYFSTRQNITWNANYYDDLTPAYTDNYYWTRYENYQNDERNRYFGNVMLEYQLNSWLGVMGRFTFDNFDEIREERIAQGSAGGQGHAENGGRGEYYLFQQNVSEHNYDVIFNIRKDLTENINLDANAGWNLRINKAYGTESFTNGGLRIPGLYTLANTLNPLTVDNITPIYSKKMVDGIYARASLGFWGMLFLDGSIRTDRSSTLPIENNRYWYPSGALSFVFSELIDQDWLSFGKIRANYAVVGNDTNPYNVFNVFELAPSFSGIALGTNPNTSNNPDLKEERMKEFEVGFEMAFLKNRISFDVSYYNRKTEDLLTPAAVSSSSGFAFLWQNAGNITNKGIEARLNLVPIRSENFRWDIGLNFAKNENEVTHIFGDNQYLELGGAWNVSIGAMLGEPYGVIRGTNYVFDAGGNRIVDDKEFLPNGNPNPKYGQYLISENEVIGNMNPDWTGSIRNTFRYKSLSLSFLIDIQHGGDVYSFDAAYGYATGLYDFTAGLNDLGNPVRNTLENGGGVILGGVKSDGTPNDIRIETNNFDNNPWGYINAPEAGQIFDASFVKLRNLTLSYDLPESIIQNTFIRKFTLSAIGRNLWIIHKNMPYSDPEAGLSAGNIQGMQNGAYPAIREIGASVRIQF